MSSTTIAQKQTTTITFVKHANLKPIKRTRYKLLQPTPPPRGVFFAPKYHLTNTYHHTYNQTMKTEPSLVTSPKAPRLRVGLKDVSTAKFKQTANTQLTDSTPHTPSPSIAHTSSTAHTHLS